MQFNKLSGFEPMLEIKTGLFVEKTMYSVGIITEQGKWSEVLSEILGSSGSTVTGWVNPLESSQLVTQQLIDYSDLIWIPEKINGNMDEAIRVIRCSRHLSLGFPIAEFMDEVPFMVKLAHEAHVQVQVGHRDWLNSAFRSSLLHINQPQSIHITDALPMNTKGDGQREVINAILADLDLALGLSGSTVRKVRPHASRLQNGTAIRFDIRVEMHNGTVIILTIRKFSVNPERLIEIVQSNGIIYIDLLKGVSRLEEYREAGSGYVMTGKNLWPLEEEAPEPFIPEPGDEKEAARQCLSFIHALERGRHSLSTLEGGYKALEITRMIEAGLGTF